MDTNITASEIRVETIDMNGKQLLIVEGIAQREFDRLFPELMAWLESDHPVFAMCIEGGCKIRLEKI